MTGVYTPPFRPYDHQAKALAKMDGQEAFALFMQMRTGKTKTLLDDYGRLELAGSCKNLMVIAPGGVYRTWRTAAEEHLSDDLKKRLKVGLWQSGMGAIAKRSFDFFMAEREAPRLLLMNVEALSSVKAAREAALAFLQADTAMLAVDESTIIKNASSQRTKFINGKLSQHAEYRRILSGLPTPKSPLDLYGQMEFLDWRILGFRSYFSFRSRYAVIKQEHFGGRVVPTVVGYRDVEDLQRRLDKNSFRVLLEDCYDLPPKVYMRREVELTPEQARMYKEMKAYATAQIAAEAHVSATVVVAQIIRLHQILCGHTVDELGNEHSIPENRTTALLEILEEHEGKAIIWCSYGHDIQKVAAALEAQFGAGSVARFWGGNVKTREAEEAAFLKDPACRFMVATASAGGRGRTWTVADLTIYYSNSYDLEARAQSEERTQGVGKAVSAAYIDLFVPDTVDEKIIQALRNKIDLAAAVTGDGYREWLI